MSEEVRDMFAEIAPTYDTTNTVLSFGIHHLWRRHTVKSSGASPGSHVLDCATGTGDLAIAFKKAVGPEGRVVGTDFCKEILEFAPDKAQREGLEIEWQVEDAMNLSFDDDMFDIASISFGIRNVDDPVQALRSMSRVVKPGGKVMVLEFGQPNGIMRPFYGFYSNVVLPAVGGLISGKKDAYDYLNETAGEFPCRDEFLALMEEAGTFESCSYDSLTGGICFLYTGTVA
jgi:demethylmenaquinone methyltransferase/2-methoxy-6-polyprenyl-1,4-benzoquinol methylase